MLHTPLFPDFPSVPQTASEHFAWHLRIAQRLPVSLFRALSENGLFNRSELSEVVFCKTIPPRLGDLPLESSNTVYRVLVALELTRKVFSGDAAKAADWLSAPQPLLRGRTPLRMLSTSMGFDYVRTAIDRLGER